MGRHSGSLNIEDERAELGTGAMIIFIAMIIGAAVISTVVIRSTELMFTAQSQDADATTEPFGGIPVIVRAEVSQLGATDEFDVFFELPFVKVALSENDLMWTVMCVPTGETRVQFDSGSFVGATPIDGDGNTGLTIDSFEPGSMYRIIISLDICDIEDVESASLIFMVENGRTVEKFLDFSNGVSVGQDLL